MDCSISSSSQSSPDLALVAQRLYPMNVKSITLHPIFTAVILLVCVKSVATDDASSIISEKILSIQIISVLPNDFFPGTNGFGPIDVSAEADRIWLIWPGTLVSLTPKGTADVRTLLAMFSSTNAKWGEKSWSPANGTVCSDGNWRGFTPSGTDYLELNTENAVVQQSTWQFSLPQTLLPGPDGAIWAFFPNKTLLIKSQMGIADEWTNHTIELKLSASIQWGISTRGHWVAEIDPLKGTLNVAKLSDDYELIPLWNLNLSQFHKSMPWSMGWVGSHLVLAYPGELIWVSSEKSWVRYSDIRIPNRWYQVRGGDDFLLIHAPESGLLMVITKEASSQEEKSDTIQFSKLLKEYALEAGLYLEAAGFPESAERFYGWVIPHVRVMRSRQPLEEYWPYLESELVRRRIQLR